MRRKRIQNGRIKIAKTIANPIRALIGIGINENESQRVISPSLFGNVKARKNAEKLLSIPKQLAIL
jgi:hypothetical protein